MSEYTYTKSLSSDFGGSLNSRQLHNAIDDNVNITTNILRIDTDGDDVDIIFDGSLSGLESSTLDSLVSAHNPVTSGDRKIVNTDLDETTSTNYQTRDTLTTEYLIAADYKIDWYYTFRSEDGTPDIRVIVDDTTVIHTNNTRVPVIGSTIQYDKTGFSVQTLTVGVHTIKLQYRGNPLSATSITSSNLFISKVR